MTLLILGKNGQVATALAELAKERGLEWVAWGRGELDLSDLDKTYAAIMKSGASAVVNAAAYTAVDKAESEAASAMRLNADVPAIIARAARELDVPFVHISTDYVFSGDKTTPYTEDDAISPISTYGLSKAEGEKRVREVYSAATILRTAWVFHESGSNFVKTMLRLGRERKELRVVADQHGNPTYAGDIALACLKIVEIAKARSRNVAGTFHFAGRGYTTWHGFAEAIFAEAAAHGWAVPDRVTAISTAEYPTPARRPANSRFDCNRIASVLEIEAPHWRDSLAHCLQRLAVIGG
ncbi:NAD(P)-dependent oxidoreductase [Rhizobium sp. NBRC 114257]|uniref:dTDP-4-dehydrorhamnose reductase n=1 Tax=Rhizobium dioscoreae TaxID=2653122 RepID=A0ABQ0ZAU8_9HYPH|nr:MULTISPECIES: dTDP-4-dehydrorhamnose reductase [Rhizobium]GES52432.1 NAD(P)-dependent oxidoreductase [Rhizobium dioscoreae]GLU83758.1 NAD(P)-dependent oxidoreductase [Rhizobium sp. NBRC 114257]